MTRYVLDLDADDDASMVRLLKRLLKLLGRVYSVRCRSVAPLHETNTSAGKGA